MLASLRKRRGGGRVSIYWEALALGGWGEGARAEVISQDAKQTDTGWRASLAYAQNGLWDPKSRVEELS